MPLCERPANRLISFSASANLLMEAIRELRETRGYQIKELDGRQMQLRTERELKGRRGECVCVCICLYFGNISPQSPVK